MNSDSKQSLPKGKQPRLSVGALGAIVALVVAVLDQANKLYLVEIFDLPQKGRVSLTPFFDLVMSWNKGISYGMLSQDTLFGRILLISFSIVVSLLFFIWMWRSKALIPALSLGLIIGGALGNVIDRIHYGAVADFYSLHWQGHYWYIFNLADVAIVIGAIGLLFTGFKEETPKTP